MSIGQHKCSLIRCSYLIMSTTKSSRLVENLLHYNRSDCSKIFLSMHMVYDIWAGGIKSFIYYIKALSLHHPFSAVLSTVKHHQSFPKAHCANTVYPKKYAHGFVVLCFVVVMQSFIMNSHEIFIYIHQGCFAGTGAIVRLPQCQWSKPDGYGKISQCITTTKHSKAKTVCIFLGIYCIYNSL